MTGLKTIFIRVDGIDGDSKKCGLDENELKETIWLPVRAYTKLQEGFDGTLVLTVLTVANEFLCAHAITLELQNVVSARLHYQPAATLQVVKLFSRAAVSTARPSASQRQLRDQVEGLARKFAAQWQKENP